VDHHDCAQLLDLLPERVELRVRQLAAVDVRPDDEAAEIEPLDGVVELLGGQEGRGLRAEG